MTGIAVAQRLTNFTAAATSHSIALPNTGEASGDVYVVFVASPAAATHSTASTGWTRYNTYGTVYPISMFYATATGEASPLVVASSTSSTMAWCAYRLTGAGTSQFFAAFTDGASSTSMAAPALTPALGSIQYQWFALIASNKPATFDPSGGPASGGWINYQSSASGSSTNTTDVYLGAVELNATASTEGPATFAAATFANTYTGLMFALPGSVTITGTDTGVGTDSAKIVLQPADSAAGTDAVSNLTATNTGTDSAAVSETAKVVVTSADSAVATESANIQLAGADTSTVTEATPKLTLASADTAAGTENTQIGNLVNVFDNVAASDSQKLSVLGADSAVLTEDALITHSTFEMGIDNAVVTDSAVVAVLVTASDSAIATESARFLISASDTATGYEYVTLRVNGKVVGSRVYLVPSDKRTYLVPYEQRKMTVPSDKRTYLVT